MDRWMLPGELARAADPDAPPGRRTPRDWAVDAAMFLVAVAVWGGEYLFTLDWKWFELPPWLRVVDPLVGALACVAVWWRRRFPVATASFAGLAGAVSNTAVGALVLLVFSLALHRGWRWAAAVTAGTVVVSAPYIYTFFPSNVTGSMWPWLLSLVLGGTLVVTAGLAVRARRKLVLVLGDESRRAERQRIAREMHDVLAHRISLLSVHAGALEYRTAQAALGAAPPPSAAEVHEAISVVRQNANQALEELGEVLRLLRTSGAGTEPPQPTAARLPALVEEARQAGQQVHADFSPELETLRPPVQRTIYRIVQEGLTNARKHAPGAVVDVRVRVRDDVLVRLTNPVLGVRTEIPGAGAGLTGLAERVAVHGGSLTAGVRNGEFQLRARIPCEV